MKTLRGLVLEYGNIIWHAHYQMDKLTIEKVQLKYLSFEERLVAASMLPPLLFRRRRGDMIQVYKIMNGIDRLDPRAFFNRALNERTRGHSQRLFMGRCRLEIRRRKKSSISQRVVQDWNSLSDHVVTATMHLKLFYFKSRLDKHWKDDRNTTLYI